MNYITYRDLGKNGRLGNQLFQIAATMAAAKKYNAFALFPEWEYQKYFAPFASSGNIDAAFHYREPAFHFTEIDWNDADCLNNSQQQNKVLNLHGYFQSEKYFDSCKRLILSAFDPLPEFWHNIKSKFFSDPIPGIIPEPIAWKQSDVVCSIHVRRGDYVNNDYYAQLGPDYYNMAIATAKQIAKQRNENIVFFKVFSDDIEYCKKMFPDHTNFYFTENTTTDIEDLFMMSLCKYNIGANSSFSWWANYLNKNKDKVAIFPKKWFGENTILDTKDLYTENMIRI